MTDKAIESTVLKALAMNENWEAYPQEIKDALLKCNIDFALRYEAAKGDGWLPISEAPRDGTRIHVTDGDVVGVVYFSRGFWYVNASNEITSITSATHFQHLPTPPTKAEG
jgi:hypothetical protein